MKKFFLLIMSLITINVFSQTDSIRFKQIEIKLLELQTNTEIFQSNLNKCHKQWVTGGGLVIAGVGFSGVGTWLLIENTMNYKGTDSKIIPYTMIGFGGLFSLIGTITILDSHKYIGRSGLSVSNGGIVYKFKQKTKLSKFYDENIKNN